MRINIYAEEITPEVEQVTKLADTGNQFTGIRFILKSPQELHHTVGDDDRSAATFWVPGSLRRGYKVDQLANAFRQAAALLEKLPQ